MLSQEEKDDLMLLGYIKGCTLDGESAHIVGRLLDFPFVAQIDGALKIGFSWETVKRIMNKDGKFSS